MLLGFLLACSSEPPLDTGEAVDSRATEPMDSADTAADCPSLGEGGAEDGSLPVIIGGGFAGLAAAIDLEEAILLESSAALGGRGGSAGNRRWRFAGTAEQAALDEESGAAATFAEWERMTGAPGTADTLAVLEASAAVRARLEGFGLAFDQPSVDFITGRHELFRALDDGPGITARLVAALPSGIDVRLGVAATGLVFDTFGVSGVETPDGVIATRRVLLASGGFAGRADLVAEVTAWPLDTLALVDHPEEGWAYDMARALCLPVGTPSAIGAMSGRLGGLGDGLAGSFSGEPPVIWVGADGARFAMEGVTGSVQGEAAWAANSPAFVLTTEEGVRAGAPEGQADRFSAALRCFDSFDTLAAAEGIDVAGLHATLAAVAAYRAGEPDPLGRDSALFPDLSGTPCAADPGRLPQKTFGGGEVDGQGRALNGEGEVVPGLWVAGEAAGMGAPGLGGQYGFDGSLTAVVWSAWRAAASMRER